MGRDEGRWGGMREGGEGMREGGRDEGRWGGMREGEEGMREGGEG